jgi:uncharacterized protein YfaP (DUF2135 family)
MRPGPESGQLEKAIKTSRNTKQSTGQVIAKVRLRGRHAFLGNFIEYGVLPHLIWSQGKESLVINGVAIGKQVEHPGYGARPFFRPAVDAKAAEAVQVVANYLATYLQFGSISAPAVSVDEEEA